MLSLFLIPLFAFLYRAHGAAWNRLPYCPEVLIAAALSYVAYQYSPWLGVVGFVVSFFGIRLGHGNFWEMDGAEAKDGPEDLEYFPKPVRDYKYPWYSKKGWIKQRTNSGVRPLYLRLGGDIHKPIYSWVCMGFKGLVIGLAAAPYGLLLAFLQPLAYYINFKLLDKPQSDGAEWIAGAFIGAILVAAWSV